MDATESLRFEYLRGNRVNDDVRHASHDELDPHRRHLGHAGHRPELVAKIPILKTPQLRQVIRQYEAKILPATQRSVESAESNYTSGKLDFLRLIDSERQVYRQRDMYYRAIAEYHRRLAELQRAVGGSLNGCLLGQ